MNYIHDIAAEPERAQAEALRLIAEELVDPVAGMTAGETA